MRGVSGLHVALAVATAAVALVGLGLAAISLARGGRLVQPWTDRTILVAMVVVLANWLAGAWIVVTGGRPTDPLHYLYAVLALAALPVTRFAGAGAAWDRRRPLVVALGAVVLVGLVVRLAQTGGG